MVSAAEVNLKMREYRRQALESGMAFMDPARIDVHPQLVTRKGTVQSGAWVGVIHGSVVRGEEHDAR